MASTALATACSDSAAQNAANAASSAGSSALPAWNAGAAATAALDGLQQAAGEEGNLLPRILDCVRQRATLGEISDRLRAVWGEYER